MPRRFLVLCLILAAFGVGFGARTIWPPQPDRPAEPGSAPELKPDDRAGAEETLAVVVEPAIEPETPAAAIAPPAPVVASVTPPAARPADPPAVLAPSSPGAATPRDAAPTTGMAQLAYAPVLPDVPDPQSLFPRAAPQPPAASANAPSLAMVPPPREPFRPEPFATADVDALKEVVAQMRKGDIAAADAAAHKLTDPAARTLAEWTLARSGQRAVGFQRIRAFTERETGWPTQPLLQRRAEEALTSEPRPAAVVIGFFETRKPLTPGGRIAFARALMAEKKRDEAVALIRTVWREDNLSDETETRIVAEFGDALRREDHRARMERYIFKDGMAKALRAAGLAGADHASLVRARAAVEGKAKNAQALLDAVPAALRADSSYAFARAQFLRRADKPVDAVKAMDGVARDPATLVDGDEWWIERRLIARKLLDAGDAKLAYKAAAEHGAGSEAMRIEAEFHAGWIALRFLRDPALAMTHFARAGESASTPMSLSRVAYWQGRAAVDTGENAAAEGHFRRAAAHGGFFYGQLARARLPAGDSPETTATIAPPATDALRRDPALRAVDLFMSTGDRDLAVSLVFDLAQRSGTPAQLDALGDILAQRRDARAVLMMGKLAMQRGLALDRHAFPTFGVPEFQPLGESVEAAMVHAIARQESAFDPKAVSHAGARGLMQLMPATARMTAVRAKAPFDVGRLTSDPVYNAQIGAAHLNDLVEEWRGSYILVFAAYNAGSHNVRKWIDAYGDPRSPDVDPVDWIERIPFTETRNYVQRILENLQVYRARLAPGPTPLMIEADLRRGLRRNAASPAPAPPALAASNPAAPAASPAIPAAGPPMPPRRALLAAE